MHARLVALALRRGARNWTCEQGAGDSKQVPIPRPVPAKYVVCRLSAFGHVSRVASSLDSPRLSARSIASFRCPHLRGTCRELRRAFSWKKTPLLPLPNGRQIFSRPAAKDDAPRCNGRRWLSTMEFTRCSTAGHRLCTAGAYEDADVRRAARRFCHQQERQAGSGVHC